MKPAQNSSRGRPDFLLLILTLLLVGFGLVMVFSASSSVAVVTYNDSLYFTKRQFMWAGLGIFVMLVMMNLRYEAFKRFFMVFFVPVVIMLLLVPFIGKEFNGAKSWFGVGSLGIQPTEPAKLAIILYLGALITKKGDKFRSFKKGLLPVIVIVGFICGLIMLQPDLGSCLVLASAATVMILAGGANLKQVFVVGSLISILLTVILSLAMALSADVRDAWAYRVDRLTIFRDPLSDSQDAGWHLVSSLQALGHGGLTGAGFGESVQKLHYLKYPYNDFIFAIIAEEFGFIGSAIFLLFYLFFLWRGLIVALRCPDQYGTVVGVGIVGLIAIQAFVNIGGVTSTIPLTGVTLPFISYGGSSLLFCLMSVGVLLSISRESNRTENAARK
ncbi:putative lipid II flippase FtsW [Paenibacillus arenilitoris]|uniref:Probable peptidoglycan glycosyltransferase FtsW n=1 Tax=Paenibacillus arenilitoris TaxID=2772299 RepID=A0A927CSL6_9BACL|nr:putative lipid II flippase FtsW [Paenibacillus arenilitoris]MBD2871476.1 putative lipid II flippase FtsW [Paenibacillus arenilitoris]